MKILLFGDQTGATQDFLVEALRQSKQSPLVNAFLNHAASTLRHEVNHLARSDRKRIPSFTTIQDLVHQHREQALGHPAIESSLICVSQVVHFIGYHEQFDSKAFPSPESRIVGLCTGLLAGVAVASSQSLADLLPLAVEVVGVAFRIGLQVGEVAEQLSSTPEKSKSWSVAFSGLNETSAREALDNFNKENGISKPNQAYTSAVGPNSVTISGTPLVLERLLNSSKTLKRVVGLPLPIHAPYHAPELYGGVDTLAIILGTRPSTSKTINRYRPIRKMYSTTTGKHVAAETTLQLLNQVVHEILQEALRWDKMLTECVAEVHSSGDLDTTVLAFGPTSAANSLVSALKNEIGCQISPESSSAWPSINGRINDYNSGEFRQSKIAIVGMAGRFPNASNHEKLWQLLENGLDVHREIPTDRFDIKSHVDPDGKKRNTSYTPYGCFINDPGHFDPRFFNMSPREAAQTDPMQRLALVTAYEALEMAGFVSNRTESTMLDRIGTFYGQTSDDYRETNASQNVDTYFITGGIRAFGPGRINFHFKFSGPSFNVDTACSSSLTAIQLACTSLWSGDCDTTVAGGLSVLTSPDLFAGLSRGYFLSKTGSCKTFDNAADGYCRADSIGTVVLKRLEDAILDNDNVLGVVLGAATNHSADAISITHPHVATQERLYKKILTQAGVDALDVNYVEMHGTGTQAGDGAEMQSIGNVFAPAVGGRSANNPLHVGAVKANLGHSEAASGVTALIKSLLILQKGSIPPHTGIKGQINQTFPDLNRRNIRIALSKTPFKAQAGKKRRVLVNNFSAAGGNTALLLEDYAEPNMESLDARLAHVVAISAKSNYSLQKNIEQLISYLDQNPYVPLENLSYTTTARRTHHSLRVAVVGTNIQAIKDSFKHSLANAARVASIAVPKLAFVFTGQGPQYSTLGKQIYEVSRRFRSDMSQLDNLSQSQGFPSFLGLVTECGDQDFSPVQVQVGLVCIQMALCRLWASWGIKPEFVVGHSLGEYAALNAAGVISASDTIFLVGHRAQLLQDICSPDTHSMLAVRGSLTELRRFLTDDRCKAEVACLNGPEEVVLSGPSSAINALNEELTGGTFKCTKLSVPFAFHSSQVDPILQKFEDIGRATSFHKPSIPVLSPLLEEVIEDAGIFNPRYLRRHARETVNFSRALAAAQQCGLVDEHTGWVEIGPQPICLGMIKAVLNPGFTIPTLCRNENAWETISNSLRELYTRGWNIDWSEYHRDLSSGHRLLILPAYAFEEKKYWIDYNHDWSLTKGQVDEGIHEEKTRQFSTTSLQRIVDEDLKEESATVTFESDFSDPSLHAAVIGHLVNDSGLCPSSIYADMALTAANYIYHRLRPSTRGPGMNVRNMEVSKPVIVPKTRTNEPHTLQIAATADLSTCKVEVEYSSINTSDRAKISNARCVVEYGDVSVWTSQWARNAYLIQSRIKSLETGLHGGDVQRILRDMAYKLFGALVQYGDKYRGMEEVMLHSSQHEATAKVQFRTDKTEGKFFMSPYWIDSIAHLSGFVLNANDSLDSNDHVFISHGWESMRFAVPLSAEKRYQAYVKMQSVAGLTAMAGDVYLFEQETVVGLIEGLRFQQIPRKLLDHLIPSGKVQTAKPAVISSKPRPPVKTSKVAVESLSAALQQVAVQAATSLTDRVRGIIALEVGIEPQEISENRQFLELGIDSLLSLAIIGKLREEFDIPFSPSLFSDHATFGALRVYLQQHEPKVLGPQGFPTATVDKAFDVTGSSSPPELTAGDINDSSSDTVSSNDVGKSSLASVLKTTIANEMGLEENEVPSDTGLGSLGMDSLMSLTVLGTLQEKTGLYIPPALLADDPSIAELERKLGVVSEPVTGNASPRNDGCPDGVAPYYPPASSILLQGSTSNASKRLFLFPDGSGSATSYASLPVLSPDHAVFGLNSPFLKSPRDYTCGISGVAQIYVTEIQKRQPRGPYTLGGWSAGGVIAYEAAYQLVQQGEKVERLVLIDAPCPVTLPPVPVSLVRFFDRIGLFGQPGQTAGTPTWLLEHFDSSVANLHRYKPKPITPSQSPKTFAIWARDGVCKDPSDPRPGLGDEECLSTQWLLDGRVDFGPKGWDELLGRHNLSGVGVPGNHFTMMREPNVAGLGEQIACALRQ